MSAKVSLNNGVTDWRFFIVIISRTDALFILTWTCLQIRVGNHKTAARETWQTKLWLKGLWNRLRCIALKCIQVILNKHPHRSFLLPPRVWMTTKEIKYCQFPTHTMLIIWIIWLIVLESNKGLKMCKQQLIVKVLINRALHNTTVWTVRCLKILGNSWLIERLLSYEGICSTNFVSYRLCKLCKLWKLCKLCKLVILVPVGKQGKSFLFLVVLYRHIIRWNTNKCTWIN
jgi:hypothetical protein